MENLYVGIDIAKANFVASIKSDESYQTKSFTNDETGFTTFESWLKKPCERDYHCCMEATGKYGYKLALFLYSRGHKVSIVNPAQVKYFMKTKLSRTKTDEADAQSIRDYCELLNPKEWTPPSPEVEKLRALIDRVDVLNKLLLQEKNRLELVNEAVENSISDHLEYLKKSIDDLETQISEHISASAKLSKEVNLLETIPGISTKTASKTVAFLGDIENFDSPRKLAAFIGLAPQKSQSGSSLNRTVLSKTGNSEWRKSYFMPAMVAIRFNPIVKEFYDRLVLNGKPKKVALCAAMRKLVHIIYGVLKSEKPFNPALAHSSK